MLILSIMNRRSFIRSLGAASLLPMIPVPTFVASASAAVTPAISAHTYKWAELIVRAHNKFSPGMLQRSLRIDSATAHVLKEQLIQNGILSAQANAYGIHAATKPLYEGAFVSVSETADTISQVATKASEIVQESEENDETIEEFDSANKDLSDETESNLEDADDDDALDQSEITSS